MLIKSSVNMSFPPIPSGLVWCYGGKGIYGHIMNNREEGLYLSFYGKEQYRGSAQCLFEDKICQDLTETELLKMDGHQIRFEVTTAPIQLNDSNKYKLEQGIIDLSGVKGVLKALKKESFVNNITF